ncbi:thermonuclease family protein [uncultured Serinicoccus sp.]|uniref:thermonuclease family protein n=1 Tax=uncultured Serinicoccus sp. TaxID=735514 RepID=UPI00261C9AA5|nr:thermonuclease family protein [uncultured Serinicoccus sp.]
MLRKLVIGLLAVVGVVVGGFVMLVIAAIAFFGVEDAEPAAQAAPAATGESSVDAETQAEQDAAAEEKAAAEKAAEDAAAEQEAAEEKAAEKAAAAEQEAAEKEAAEKAAAEKIAADAAAEKAAADAAAEQAAAEKAAADTEAAERAAADTLTVVAIVDGDTVDVSNGARIRIAGIDTPERGECGYDEAGARMMKLARDRQAVLVLAGADSIDRYGRLIRYLDVDGRDVGLTLIQEGLATARYDSRDGYGWHDREAEYVAADAASPQAFSCPAQPSPQPAAPAAPAAPAIPAGSGTDPQFGTCAEALAHGYGWYVVGVDPEYHWYRDGDGDGVVCET